MLSRAREGQEHGPTFDEARPACYTVSTPAREARPGGRIVPKQGHPHEGRNLTRLPTCLGVPGATRFQAGMRKAEA